MREHKTKNEEYNQRRMYWMAGRQVRTTIKGNKKMKTKLEGTVVGKKRTQLTDEIMKISRNLVENEMKTVC